MGHAAMIAFMSAASDIALMATMPLPEQSGGSVPEWVHLLPRGERIETWDGRGPFRYGDGPELIRASMTSGHARIVIDEKPFDRSCRKGRHVGAGTRLHRRDGRTRGWHLGPRRLDRGGQGADVGPGLLGPVARLPAGQGGQGHGDPARCTHQRSQSARAGRAQPPGGWRYAAFGTTGRASRL